MVEEVAMNQDPEEFVWGDVNDIPRGSRKLTT